MKILKAGIFVLLISSSACAGRIPQDIGVKDMKLKPCPSSPNCVSTQAQDETHKIEPYKYTGSLDSAREKIVAIVNSLPRTKIVESKPDYLRVEFKSFLFRFVDDVEFYFDDKAKVVHFRSASRVGYGDMGVNRKRMEGIREKFQAEK